MDKLKALVEKIAAYPRREPMDVMYNLGKTADIQGIDVPSLFPFAKHLTSMNEAAYWAQEVAQLIVGDTRLAPEHVKRNLGAFREGLFSTIYQRETARVPKK